MFFTEAVELLERVRGKIDILNCGVVTQNDDLERGYDEAIFDALVEIDQMIAIYKKLPNDAIKDVGKEKTSYAHDEGC